MYGYCSYSCSKRLGFLKIINIINRIVISGLLSDTNYSEAKQCERVSDFFQQMSVLAHIALSNTLLHTHTVRHSSLMELTVPGETQWLTGSFMLEGKMCVSVCARYMWFMCLIYNSHSVTWFVFCFKTASTKIDNRMKLHVIFQIHRKIYFVAESDA